MPRSAIAPIAGAMPARRWSAGPCFPTTASRSSGRGESLCLVRAWPAAFLPRLRDRPVLHQRRRLPRPDRRAVGDARRSRRAADAGADPGRRPDRLDEGHRRSAGIRALSRPLIAGPIRASSPDPNGPSYAPEPLPRARLLTLQTHWRNEMNIRTQLLVAAAAIALPAALGPRRPRRRPTRRRRWAAPRPASRHDAGARADRARRRVAEHPARPGCRPSRRPRRPSATEAGRHQRDRHRAGRRRDGRGYRRPGRGRPRRRLRPRRRRRRERPEPLRPRRRRRPTTTPTSRRRRHRDAARHRSGPAGRPGDRRPRPPTSRTGATVRDQQGGVVGTIEIGRRARARWSAPARPGAKVPLASFGRNGQGLVIAHDQGPVRGRGPAQSPAARAADRPAIAQEPRRFSPHRRGFLL